MPLRIGSTFAPRGLQEHLEPPLGQYDGPEESVAVEPDQFLDLCRHGVEIVETDARVVQAHQLMADPSPGVRGRTEDFPGPPIGPEAELDLHDFGPVRDEGHTPPLVPGAPSVEGEEKGLEDRGLAGPRVAHDGHETRVSEVDELFMPVAAKPGHPQGEGPHNCSS